MKRVVFILLCALLADVAYAQTDMRRVKRGVEAAVEKAMREHNAKQKKAKEEAERKEREKARRHEQQRRQHEANYNRQINNLNQVSAEDFLNTPRQQGSTNTAINGASKNQQVPVTAQRKTNTNINRPTGTNYGNSGRIGTPSYSGNDYTGDRYNFKRAGFNNTQPHEQVRVPANQYRQKYPSQRPVGNQKVISMRSTKASSKVSIHTSAQQGHVQSARQVQTLPRPQTSVQRKVAWVENGKVHLDTSRPIVIKSQPAFSADLSPVDTRKIDYATKVNNITVYTFPDEAYQLSDRDNKITSRNVKGLANDERTQAKQMQLMREDAMNGFSSIENRQKWEYIYGYVYVGEIKIPSRSATQKRR